MARNKLQVVNKSRSEKYNIEKPTKTEEEKKKTKTIKKEKVIKEKTVKQDQDEEIEIKQLNPFVKKIIILFIVIITVFISYSMFVEPNLLQVKEYKIETSKIEENFVDLDLDVNLTFSPFEQDENNKLQHSFIFDYICDRILL